MQTLQNSDQNRCKVCGDLLFTEPLLRYKNMPSVAQHLPDAETVQEDRGMDLDIFQCSACGLVQLHTEPVPYFREVIRAVGVSDEMKKFRTGQFAEFVKTYGLTGKKIIEIGSGRGEYLSIMGAQGIEAYGIEFADTAVQASAESGLRVQKGFIDHERYAIENGPFDAFFIISFFEHLPDPNQVLRGIYHNISENGVGIVEVPNFDMMIRDNLFSEFMRDHLFYFRSDTLRNTLEMNGFEVLEIKEVWHAYILSAIVKKKTKLRLPGFFAHETKLRKELNGFIEQFPNVAIWGAGHQAFALMAMMQLGGRIRYVVDSAPFKQGKFTPASHIPIVSPHTLNTDPVDAVIIMAGSYSDEIKKIMREKYGSGIELGIVRDFGFERVL